MPSKVLLMVATVFPARTRSDAIMLGEAFMVSASHIAVFCDMPEGVHTKYSVNWQQVNQCMGRWLHYIRNSYILRAVVNYIPAEMTLE